jgi:hypothetical protein
VSTLRVGNLTAVGGTGNIIVPSGNQLVQAGAILQVVSASKIDTFSSTGSTFVDVTGLSVTVTPQSLSSKVLLIAQLNMGLSATAEAALILKLIGGNSASYVPEVSGVRALGQCSIRYRGSVYEAGYWAQTSGSITYLDSPNTTSATTYKIQASVPVGTGYINRTGEDVSNAVITRLSSSLTALEVAG